MKSITIHDMDDELAARLERQARESGLSLNKTVKKLLAKAFGLSGADHRRGFEDMCGIWSKREAKTFKRSIRDFESVNREDWA